MKIRPGFLLHSFGDENVVVAVEERTADFSGMIRLNSTGAFLWRLMEKECTVQSLAEALIKEYGITEEPAEKAVASFIDQFSGTDIIER